MKILDTRDLYQRKCELEELRDALTEAREALADAEKELEEHHATQKGEEYDEETWEEQSEALQEAVSDAEGNVESALIDFGEDEKTELEELEALEGEISEFMHGEAMIPEDDFEDYARELAEDIHRKAIRDASWPFTCINWSDAADELRQDYSEIEYQGSTYLVRA